jgi:hypothetical protein
MDALNNGCKMECIVIYNLMGNVMVWLKSLPYFFFGLNMFWGWWFCAVEYFE